MEVEDLYCSPPLTGLASLPLETRLAFTLIRRQREFCAAPAIKARRTIARVYFRRAVISLPAHCASASVTSVDRSCARGSIVTGAKCACVCRHQEMVGHNVVYQHLRPNVGNLR